MAAPRKYSDAQRAEIWRLHEAGLTSEEISATCARGTAAVTAFEIPRRSVSEIVTRIAEQHRIEVPESAGDVDGLDTVRRFPERIARIFDVEIERLAAKQRRGQLTVKDLELLRKATEISGPLSKRLEGSSKRHGPSSRDTKKAQPEESAIGRLAREEREERDASGREAGLGHAHTRPTSSNEPFAGSPKLHEPVAVGAPGQGP
jgi:hypothetical protein